MTRFERWVSWPDQTEQLDLEAFAPGFAGGTASAGIKAGDADDVAVIASQGDPDIASALFLTANAAAAAPVRLCRERCDIGEIAAVMVNSGNANAATGEQGFADALALQKETAQLVGLSDRRVAVAQTGVIGVRLEMPPLLEATAEAAGKLSAEGATAVAEAIMTTDKGPKQIAVRCGGVTVSAQAKGAGMIEPGFATMLCFVQTDAVADGLEDLARQAVDGSFSLISVDGQMSTNDTVLIQSSGLSGRPLPDGLLEAVLLELALEIVADGEGATRVGRIEVTGARDQIEAKRVARAVANSPLVKTALHGRDPNWGRILQAAGAALAGEDLSALDHSAVSAGELGEARPDAEISVELSRGEASAHAYFSDLTKRYVEINSEYTT